MKCCRSLFLEKLAYAASQAKMNRSAMRRHAIRDAVERAELPLPPWKDLKSDADVELQVSGNPFYFIVEAESRTCTEAPSRLEFETLLERAWEYYQNLPEPVPAFPTGRLDRGCGGPQTPWTR